MKELGSHSHVVSMLGCCTLQEPYCLLVEHMAKGDLLNYLKNIRRSIADVSFPLDLRTHLRARAHARTHARTQAHTHTHTHTHTHNAHKWWNLG